MQISFRFNNFHTARCNFMSLTQKIGQVIALSCLISGSFIPTALSSTAPQETIQKSESQTILAQRRGSAYVCTRDRNE